MSGFMDFVLDYFDEETGCVVGDVPFAVENLNLLCAQIMLNPSEFNPALEYDLEEEDIYRISRKFDVNVEGRRDCKIHLREKRPTDDLPYKIHTGRELVMMLAGSKPLAAFVEEYPKTVEYEIIPESKFEPYVLSGRFIKRERLYADQERNSESMRGARCGMRRVLYSQVDESWRIDAYLLLQEVVVLSGWSEGFERMEGTLLGYEQWQNDAFLKFREKPRPKT